MDAVGVDGWMRGGWMDAVGVDGWREGGRGREGGVMGKCRFCLTNTPGGG